MKIKSIAATHFKRGSFSEELAPITCFIGPNGAGKTSRLDALQLALCGYHPRLAKQNAAIMSLACGPSMSVCAELEDGTLLERQWSRNKDTVKRVESEACAELSIPSVLIDPDSYFALSDKERVKYVFGLVPMPDGGSVFQQLVAELKNHKFEENTKETENAIGTMSEIIHRASRTPLPVQEVLEALVKDLKERKASTDAVVKRMIGTVQGVTELAATPVADPGPELAAKRKELEQLLVRQRDLENALWRAQIIKADIYGLSQDGHTGDLAKEVAALQAQTQNYQSSTRLLEDQIASCLARKDKARVAANVASKTYEDAQRTAELRSKLADELAACQQQALGLAELETELAQKVERNKVLAQSSRIVPKDVEMLVTVAEILEQEFILYKEKSGLLAQCLRKMLSNNAADACDTASLCVQIAAKKSHQHRAQCITTSLAGMTPMPDLVAAAMASAAADEACEKLEAEFTRIQNELAAARAADAQHSQLRVTLAQKEAQLTKLQEAPKRIAALQAEMAALPAADATVDALVAACRLDIHQLELRLRQYVAQKGEAATKQKALEQRKLLEAESLVAKAAVELVQTTQAKMVETAFVEILKVANRVTHGVLRGPLEYRDGEIGVWVKQPVGEQWVSHRTMSGSEQLVTYASLGVSLAAKSPIRVLLLDECQRLDAEHAGSLMLNLVRLIHDGVLDNVVLAGLAAPPLVTGDVGKVVVL